ncbi:hypothetical protein NDU88_008948 [Pleurodeles waltl]|uniref:Uncharacterized protein n=1 Tax=Pleurodeles waltl TaxID=8319 RepID=A0AAV7PTI9_PLEWA|nr:hypothetical protein NDU88_008948 [Pleurodeles waltl]
MRGFSMAAKQSISDGTAGSLVYLSPQTAAKRPPGITACLQGPAPSAGGRHAEAAKGDLLRSTAQTNRDNNSQVPLFNETLEKEKFDDNSKVHSRALTFILCSGATTVQGQDTSKAQFTMPLGS